MAGGGVNLLMHGGLLLVLGLDMLLSPTGQGALGEDATLCGGEPARPKGGRLLRRRVHIAFAEALLKRRLGLGVSLCLCDLPEHDLLLKCKVLQAKLLQLQLELQRRLLLGEFVLLLLVHGLHLGKLDLLLLLLLLVELQLRHRRSTRRGPKAIQEPPPVRRSERSILR
jgi:hypothetical protein